LQNTHENNFNLCIKANFFKLLRAFAPVLHNSCKKFGKNQCFCKDLCENIYFCKNLHKISYHNKLKNKSTFVKKFPTMLLISNSKKAKKNISFNPTCGLLVILAADTPSSLDSDSSSSSPT
jgi:hypothetical protein